MRHETELLAGQLKQVSSYRPPRKLRQTRRYKQFVFVALIFWMCHTGQASTSSWDKRPGWIMMNVRSVFDDLVNVLTQSLGNISPQAYKKDQKISFILSPWGNLLLMFSVHGITRIHHVSWWAPLALMMKLTKLCSNQTDFSKPIATTCSTCTVMFPVTCLEQTVSL